MCSRASKQKMGTGDLPWDPVGFKGRSRENTIQSYRNNDWVNLSADRKQTLLATVEQAYAIAQEAVGEEEELVFNR